MVLAMNTIRIQGELGHIVFEEEPVHSIEQSKSFRLHVDEEAKLHTLFRYTTDLETTAKIFGNLTIQATSLGSRKLNDKLEKQRRGVETYAHGRFATCFSHDEHECVPFWVSYGKKKLNEKIQLCFHDLAARISECFYWDYAFVGTGKVFFLNEEYKKTVNTNGLIGIVTGTNPVNEDYDTRAVIDMVHIFDVKYLPSDDSAFTKSYASTDTIQFGTVTLPNVPVFQPGRIGMEKTNPWEYEKESRILVKLQPSDFSEWEWIRLRIEPEAFRNLTIILSPWENEMLENKVRDILREAQLPSEIKETISIRHSEVKDMLNFGEDNES